MNSRWAVALTMPVAALVGSAKIRCGAFYMSKVPAKMYYDDNQEIPLKVNAMTSVHTQISQGYYWLPFCQPNGGPKMMASQNWGEFLTGNQIQSSPYHIQMRKEMYCQILCLRELSTIEARKLQLHIKYGYHHNWIIDNLPSVSYGINLYTQYAGGFPIGFVDTSNNHYYMYNHVNIMLDIHRSETSSEYRVVGFRVEPMSIKHSFRGNFDWDGIREEGFSKDLQTCPGDGIHMDYRTQVTTGQIVREGDRILYTYDVTWSESDIAWSSRWDVYLAENNLPSLRLKCLSIINSIFMLFFVANIIVRSFRRNIASIEAARTRSNDTEEEEERPIHSGWHHLTHHWKFLHADVFRPPRNFPMLYCAVVGSGVQIGATLFFVIVLFAAGYLDPVRRGSLMQGVLITYMPCGFFAGYVSSRLFKAFGGQNLHPCTFFTAMLFPGICFSIFLPLNILLAIFHSTRSVPFHILLLLIVVWFCIYIPLVFTGAHVGYNKTKTIHLTAMTSRVARPIPKPSNLLLRKPVISMCLAGILPFLNIHTEISSILDSLWMNKYYHVYGITLIFYLVLLISVAEYTIISVYYRLCNENHRWWWSSFFTGASTSVCTFLYSLSYFKNLEANHFWITYFLYFGYMFILSSALFLMTGAIGALTSFWFIRKMFSSIDYRKADGNFDNSSKTPILHII